MTGIFTEANQPNHKNRSQLLAGAMTGAGVALRHLPRSDVVIGLNCHEIVRVRLGSRMWGCLSRMPRVRIGLPAGPDAAARNLPTCVCGRDQENHCHEDEDMVVKIDRFMV